MVSFFSFALKFSSRSLMKIACWDESFLRKRRRDGNHNLEKAYKKGNPVETGLDTFGAEGYLHLIYCGDGGIWERLKPSYPQVFCLMRDRLLHLPITWVREWLVLCGSWMFLQLLSTTHCGSQGHRGG